MATTPKTWKCGTLSCSVLVLGAIGLCALCLCVTGYFAGIEAVDFLSYYGGEWVSPCTTMTKFSFGGTPKVVAFSPDSEHILAAIDSYRNQDGKETYSEIRVWNTATKQEIHSKRFDLPICSMQFHPDGKRLLIAIHDVLSDSRIPKPDTPAQILIVEYPTLRLLHRLAVGKTIALYGAKFSPDGKWVAALKKDSHEYWDPWEIMIYESTGLKYAACIPELYTMYAFDFMPDSKHVIAGYYAPRKPQVAGPNDVDPVLDAFDVETGKRKKGFPNLANPSSFEHVGNRLIANYGLHVAEFESLEKHRLIEITKDIREAGPRKHSPDGQHQVCAKAEWTKTRHSTPSRPQIALADLRTKQLIRIYRHNNSRDEYPTCTAFSGDGTLFVVGTSSFPPAKKDGEGRPGRVLLFTVPD